jgi:hypothetical protein
VPRTAIFWPTIALVVLTAVVGVRMFVVRIGEMRTRRIAPQSVATSRTAAAAFQDIAAADNFRNLFEVPVLFYAACAALVILDRVSVAQLLLAWIFVALRAVHSAIHLTYNSVVHRFTVYAISTAVVFAMWMLLAFTLAREAP